MAMSDLKDMDLNELVEKINSFDINDVDWNNIGSSPLPARILLILLACAAVVATGYYLFISKQWEDLGKLEKKETEVRQQFELQHKKAVHLDEYIVQLEEMKRSFGTMLKQLPSETEISSLIVDVSQTALTSGLEIESFRPMEESVQGFYAEQAFELRVLGDYHDLGAFVSGIAGLPRIVTLHNITIKRENQSRTMVMEAVAKTYRYVDESEEDE